MKIFRYFIAAVLVFGVLGVTGVANAITFKVLDPAVSQTDFPGVNESGSNAITFYNCTVVTGDGCFTLVLNNLDTLTSFVGTIDSPITLPDSTDSSSICPTDGETGFPNGFSTVNCSVLNNVITFDLSGPPGITGPANIYLVEDGIPAADFLPNVSYGSFTVTTTTPEPSSLLLALSGLGPLGYLIRRRRKTS